MLGHLHAAGRNNDGGSRRDVERAHAVTTRADHVDGISWGAHAQAIIAQDLSGGGNLPGRFTAQVKKGHKGRHLRFAGLPTQHDLEGLRCFISRERGPGGDAAQQRLEEVGVHAARARSRKFLRRA